MADPKAPEAPTPKGPRWYIGHVYSLLSSADTGHVHEVAQDGTISCEECAGHHRAPLVGTRDAETAQTNPELNPAAAVAQETAAEDAAAKNAG